MTTREPVVPVLLEKVYKLIESKVEGSNQPLVTKLAKHIFSNVSPDDLLQRNESDLYGAVVSLWHHLNEKNTMKCRFGYSTRRSVVMGGNQLTLF